MKRSHFLKGFAIAAWMAIVPVGFAQAQGAGGIRIPSGVTPDGRSTTNYIGGAGGIPSRTFGRITSDNVVRPNGAMQDNRGSAMQFRGQAAAEWRAPAAMRLANPRYYYAPAYR